MSHEFAPAVVALVTEHFRTAATWTRPLDLARLITGPSAANVRDFAAAFRLRRRRDS